MTHSPYSADYFSSGIFSQDYEPVATAILDTYHPDTILDVGCGPGHLSRILATRTSHVVALDGYSEPRFDDPRITFHRCDLNSRAALDSVAGGFKARFDVAVCLEVAEHLEPSTSDQLIRFLCAHARIVVFSAAVPGQGGAGHINCQSREAWHQRFQREGFKLVHRLRPQLVCHPDLPPWYRFNLLDYAAASEAALFLHDPLSDLLAVESIISGELYAQGEVRTALETRLRYLPVRSYLSLRSWAKRLLRPTASAPTRK